MPKSLTQLADTIIYSNLLISLCAVAMTLQSYWQLGQSLIFDELLAIIFCSTLATYLLARLVGLRRLTHKTKQKYWYGRNESLIKYLFIISSLACLPLFLVLKYNIQLCLIFLAVLTILYSLPLIRTKGKWKHLRDIGLLKIFLISFTWSITTVLLPAFNIEKTINWDLLFFMFIERTFFIFAITLPFDIRDLKYDTGKIKTIPLILGTQKTLLLAYFFLFFLILLATSNYVYIAASPRYDVFAGLIISYLITAYIISFTDENNKDTFYTGYVDATMMLQFLLIAGFRFII
ncbi:MAG: hypothetical protein ACPG5B_13500 [Chitinophagales bacterium]